MADTTSIVSASYVEQIILVLRGNKVLLDKDLARLYGVVPKQLNQAVKRNRSRFPADFMFQLTWEEVAALTNPTKKSSPPSSSKKQNPRSQIVTLESGSNLKYRPFAFTEQGIAMLSSVLRSPRAVRVNIEIMRAFVRLRQLLATQKDMSLRIDELEKKFDRQFAIVFDAIRDIIEPPDDSPPKRSIGYHTEWVDEDLEHTKTVAAIERGISQMKRGKGIPAREAFDKLRKMK
ncbi:MAG: ORF6N domain-containing protein [Phycisphaerales bacterium]|nr:ORF6N domain-containing protein [Phycisphaerales bacterium]